MKRSLAARRRSDRLRKKLNAAKRREIAKSFITGRKSGAEISRLYNINQPTVSRIPKQARFVEEYLFDVNGKAAAIRAGYSPKNAEVQASRLLSYVKVRLALQDAMQGGACRAMREGSLSSTSSPGWSFSPASVFASARDSSRP